MELPGVMGGVGFPPRGELGYPDISPRLPGWNTHKHRVPKLVPDVFQRLVDANGVFLRIVRELSMQSLGTTAFDFVHFQNGYGERFYLSLKQESKFEESRFDESVTFGPIPTRMTNHNTDISQFPARWPISMQNKNSEHDNRSVETLGLPR